MDVMKFNWETMAWEKTTMPESEYFERREMQSKEVLTVQEFKDVEHLLETFEPTTWEEMEAQGGEPETGNIADLSFTGVPKDPNEKEG